MFPQEIFRASNFIQFPNFESRLNCWTYVGLNDSSMNYGVAKEEHSCLTKVSMEFEQQNLEKKIKAWGIECDNTQCMVMVCWQNIGNRDKKNSLYISFPILFISWFPGCYRCSFVPQHGGDGCARSAEVRKKGNTSQKSPAENNSCRTSLTQPGHTDRPHQTHKIKNDTVRCLAHSLVCVSVSLISHP